MQIAELVEDIMPTRITVADAHLDRRLLVFEGFKTENAIAVQATAPGASG